MPAQDNFKNFNILLKILAEYLQVYSQKLLRENTEKVFKQFVQEEFFRWLYYPVTSSKNSPEKFIRDLYKYFPDSTCDSSEDLLNTFSTDLLRDFPSL